MPDEPPIAFIPLVKFGIQSGRNPENLTGQILVDQGRILVDNVAIKAVFQFQRVEEWLKIGCKQILKPNGFARLIEAFDRPDILVGSALLKFFLETCRDAIGSGL